MTIYVLQERTTKAESKKFHCLLNQRNIHIHSYITDFLSSTFVSCTTAYS